MEETKPYFLLQTLEKALVVLDQFIIERRALSITEVAAKLKLHKSIIHRLMATLCYYHYLEKEPETDKYRVGQKAFQLGTAYMNMSSLIEQSQASLTEMVNESGNDAHLGVLDQGSVIYLLNLEPARSYRNYTSFGTRNMVHFTALGKCLAAWKNENEILAIIKKEGMPTRTPHTITDPKLFLEELQQVRQQGYAVDYDESLMGARCLGAPIFDYSGGVVASISMSGSKETIPEKQMKEMIRILKKHARLISIRLGYFD